MKNGIDSRLIVKNVGPIKEADIRLKKVNVFIGPQSSGKSTIAKIISFCSWLEKNKHELEGSYLFTSNVINKMVAYHRMENYISDDSQIFYQGDNVAFAFNWKTDIPLEFPKGHYSTECYNAKECFFFNIERHSNPKVLYVPAERNFVSVVPNLQKYDDSKDSLQSFIVDWFESKRSYSKDSPLNLIDLGMKYFSENDRDYIQIGNEQFIHLRNASSGIQSVVPLIVLADYMTNGMYSKERPFSVEEQDVLDKVLHKLTIENLPTKDIEDIKRRLAGFLQGKVYTHTQFIVEEPEQNLYPIEQYQLIDYLIGIINHGRQHRLTITTHSPYIISFLNVLLRRSNDSKSYLRNEDLNAILISEGILTNLIMHDESKLRWAVDVSALNTAMDNIVSEFNSLVQ